MGAGLAAVWQMQPSTPQTVNGQAVGDAELSTSTAFSSTAGCEGRRTCRLGPMHKQRRGTRQAPAAVDRPLGTWARRSSAPELTAALGLYPYDGTCG